MRPRVHMKPMGRFRNKVDGATSFILLQKSFAITSILLSTHLGAASLHFALASLSIRRAHQSCRLLVSNCVQNRNAGLSGCEGQCARRGLQGRRLPRRLILGTSTPTRVPTNRLFYISRPVSSGVQGTRVCGSIRPA